MAITFVAAGAVIGSSADVTVALPAGWAEDDIFLIHLETRGDQAVPVPVGWTELANAISTNSSGIDDTRCTVLWRRATSSESNVTITDPGNHVVAFMTAWRGCETSGSPFDATQTSSDATLDTSITATGPTTTVANAMVVFSTAAGDESTFSAWANSNLVSITEAQQGFTAFGSDGAVGAAYGIKAAAGAVGNSTATVSTAEEEANVVTALIPAGAPSGGVPILGGLLAGGRATNSLIS